MVDQAAAIQTLWGTLRDESEAPPAVVGRGLESRGGVGYIGGDREGNLERGDNRYENSYEGDRATGLVSLSEGSGTHTGSLIVYPSGGIRQWC